jgi:hypothetical protein
VDIVPEAKICRSLAAGGDNLWRLDGVALGDALPYSKGDGSATPEVEKKLNDLAAESARGINELLEDALAGYLDELAQTQHMLNSRYDDRKSGRVKLISRDEVAAPFREKCAAARRDPPGS